MNKKEKIIHALRELFQEGKAGTASVSEIAKKAGIAKGGLYYYFRSKEEILDALIEREYEDIIQACDSRIRDSKGNAVEKLALLVRTYRSSYVDATLDQYLHMPQNAALHQKSLSQILTALSEIITRIIGQGIEEGIFICEYPQEYSEIILSAFTFLLDPGIFLWTKEQYMTRLRAIADIMENGLHIPKGSLSFFYS